MENIQDGQWLGFCAYRRFWSNEMNKFEINSLNDFLLETPKEWEGHQTVLGQNIHMNWKLSKILKHGLKSLIKNPKLILKKIGI